jgi:hypothetical protein
MFIIISRIDFSRIRVIRYLVSNRYRGFRHDRFWWYVYTYVYTYIYTYFVCIYLYICMFTYIHIYTFSYVYTFRQFEATGYNWFNCGGEFQYPYFISMYLHTYTHVCIFIFMHIYIYTYIYIHTFRQFEPVGYEYFDCGGEF